MQFHGDFGPGGVSSRRNLSCCNNSLFLDIWNQKITNTYNNSVFEIINVFWTNSLLYHWIFWNFSGSNFLDYNTLNSNHIFAQELGIFIVELGVGICVFSVMLLIFYLFLSRGKMISILLLNYWVAMILIALGIFIVISKAI